MRDRSSDGGMSFTTVKNPITPDPSRMPGVLKTLWILLGVG
jgi:hypothetical protein